MFRRQLSVDSEKAEAIGQIMTYLVMQSPEYVICFADRLLGPRQQKPALRIFDDLRPESFARSSSSPPRSSGHSAAG